MIPSFLLLYLSALGFLQDVHPSGGTSILDEIQRIVTSEFHDPGRVRGTFTPAAARYRKRAAACNTAQTLSAAVNAWLATLHASHTGYFTSADPLYYRLAAVFRDLPEVRRLFPEGRIRYPSLGLHAGRVSGRVFVLSVLDGGPAQKAGVLSGDEIVSLNGKPFTPIQGLSGKEGKDAALLLRRDREGAPFPVRIAPRWVDPTEEYLEAERKSIKILEAGGRSIGYIHLWSYAGARFHEVLVEAVTRGALRDADALILDLRDGLGGADPEYLNLFNRKVPVLVFQDARGHRTVIDTQWRKPTALLVNGRVRSGKEILAFAFKRYGLGTLVGERTAGAVAGGRVFVLSNKAMLYLACRRVRVDGVELEGRGVEPDIHVPREIPYARGRDPQLEAAVTCLVERLGKRSKDRPKRKERRP